MNNSNNKPFRPFIILITVLGFLIMLSTIDHYFAQFNHDIKHLDLLSQITIKQKDTLLHSVTVKNDENFEKILKDTLSQWSDTLQKVNVVKDTVKGLDSFYEGLRNIKTKKKIRIAWFGDSMVEGDLITQELRAILQKKYGGSGVGIVPITSVTAGFRRTINHTFSENWKNKNLLDPISDEALGITGYVFNPQNLTISDTSNPIPADASWVRYKSSKMRGLDKFHKVRLYYGLPTDIDASVHIEIDNMTRINKILNGKEPVNTLEIDNEQKTFNEIKFTFINRQQLPVYAVSFESDTGVFVDNLSFRGNSGLPLSKIPQHILAEFNEKNQYDLIILEYGMNAVSAEITDYSWYQRGLDRIVKHIKRSFPNTALLFIGVPDKGYKDINGYITNPAIPLVINAERNAAENNGAAFWNLFEAMGGYNSMVKWVESDTALANKDYTHFNFRGASKVARLLYQELDKGYNEYLKSTENKQKNLSY